MSELTREQVITILDQSRGDRRDYAIACLTGMLANPVLFTHVAQRSKPEQIPNRFADLALQHADALIVQMSQPLAERYPEAKSEIVL